MLERGREYEASHADQFEPLMLAWTVRLARLADDISETLRDCPDASVRRSAAVLAARAHPILAAFDG